jgi:hypothetical protein
MTNGIAIRNGTEYLFNSNAYYWNIFNFLNVLSTFGVMDTLYLECTFIDPFIIIPHSVAYVSESFHKWQQQYKDPKPWKTVAEFLTRYGLIDNVNVSLASSMRQQNFNTPIIEGLVSGIPLNQWKQWKFFLTSCAYSLAVSKVIYQLESNDIHALAGQISVTGSLDPKKLFTVSSGNEKVSLPFSHLCSCLFFCGADD